MDFPAPIDPTYTPKVSITKLPASAPLSEILSILDRDGGIILENFVNTQDLQNIESELQQSERQQGRDYQPATGIPILPSQTRAVAGLVGKSATVASICESNPVLTQLRDELLTDRFSITREEQTEEYTIDPLLSISLSFQIGPGAPRQRLHRDDGIHGIDHDKQQPFDLRKISQFACLIAGCRTTRENGATMFVPGSHRWGQDHHPRLDEVCFAEMEAGSALIFVGAAFHGGGHNSVPDFVRTMHGLFFVRGTLRPEENQFLTVPHSQVSRMGPKMLSLLGYKKPAPALGLVNNRDPCIDLANVLEMVKA